ncbi:MAG: hypothetical protein IKP20_07215 [Candidatus Methanomethylophilaceae archaeon]|nr:hypothetical protein [Candidatus Methanomethylophilaceae archaeon]
MNKTVLKILTISVATMILFSSSGCLSQMSAIENVIDDGQVSFSSIGEQIFENQYPYNEDLLLAIYTSNATTSFSDGVQHEIKAASSIWIPRGIWSSTENGSWDYAFVTTGMGESTDGDYIRIAFMDVDGTSDHGPMIMTPDTDSTRSWCMPSSTGSGFNPTPAISLIAQTLISILNPTMGINVISSLLLSFIGMMKGSSSGFTISDNHFTRTLTWNPDIDWTGQNMAFIAHVLPGEDVSFTTEYAIFGPTYEYLSAGKHIISISAPSISEGGPSAMTIEEREAAGIVTVTKAQLQALAPEFGLSNDEVQEMMDSDDNEFYFTSVAPSCVTEEPEEADQGYGSRDALLDAIAKKISVSEKIIAAFSEDDICDLLDSQEIVARHAIKLESLRALDRLVRFGIHSQNSLERMYDMYWNLIGRANDLVSNFGNDILLSNVSSGYVREALDRGPAIVSDTLDGLRASAMNGIFDTLGDGEALLVGSNWLSGNASRMRMIAEIAASGHPVIMSGNSPDALSTENIGLPTAYSDSADVYGLWHDDNNNITYCYSEIGGELNDSIESAFEWTENSQSNTPTPGQLAPENSVVYSLTKTHGNYGDLIVNTEYDLIEIEDDLYIALTHYKLTGDANVSTSFWDRWTAVSDLRVSCEHNYSFLIDYDPHISPTGNGTQNVNICYPDTQFYIGWSFQIEDTTFHDSSSLLNNTFSLWYDIDECEANDGKSYTIEPGTIAEISTDDIQELIQEIEERLNENIVSEEDRITIKPFRYSETEHYSVTFFRDRTLLPDQTETVECDITVTLI